MDNHDVEGPPLVSVVIPSYDRPELLVDAIESVRQQTYDHVELLVVDDHSPDPVEPVVRESTDGTLARVRCIRHETNQGANAARNTGIDAAEGTFVAFLDDDDRWMPTFLEQVVETFREADPDVGVVVAGSQVVDGTGTQIGQSSVDLSGDPVKELINGALVGSFSRFAVRRTVIEQAGLPDERFPSWQDTEWQFRLAQHCRFESIPDPLVVRRLSGHEQISDDYQAKRDVSYPLLMEKHRSLAAEYGPWYERRFVSRLSLGLGSAALEAGHWAEGLRYVVKSLIADPTNRKGYIYLCTALGGPVTYSLASRLKRTASGTLSG